MNFALSFIPQINRPTRITSTSATIIDNFFSNLPLSKEISNGILLADLNDHFPIFTSITKIEHSKPKDEIKKRKFNTTNKESFKTQLNDIDWTSVTDEQCPQKSYMIFHNHLTKTFEKCFPIQTIKKGYTNRHPWISYGLKMCIQKKHTLHIRSLRYSTTKNIKIYKDYKNKLTRILKNAERTHYMEQFVKYQSNMKKSWDLIKKCYQQE
jgi:hypothetical protein